MTFCIVEHQMGMVMEIADQVAVLYNGRLIAEGPPDIVGRDAQVMDAYLKGRGRCLTSKNWMSTMASGCPRGDFS